MQHLRYLAATICSYHRLQYTQTAAVPLRETTCKIENSHKEHILNGKKSWIPKTQQGYLDQKQNQVFVHFIPFHSMQSHSNQNPKEKPKPNHSIPARSSLKDQGFRSGVSG
jgi:hypothetical protein